MCHFKPFIGCTIFFFRNFVKWSEKDGINRLDHKAYLNAFKESFYQSVIALIDKAVRKERQLIQDDLYIEVSRYLYADILIQNN